MAAAGVTERGVVGASKIAERLVEHTAAGVGVVEALEDDVKKRGMKNFLFLPIAGRCNFVLRHF